MLLGTWSLEKLEEILNYYYCWSFSSRLSDCDLSLFWFSNLSDCLTRGAKVVVLVGVKFPESGLAPSSSESSAEETSEELAGEFALEAKVDSEDLCVVL